MVFFSPVTEEVSRSNSFFFAIFLLYFTLGWRPIYVVWALIQSTTRWAAFTRDYETARRRSRERLTWRCRAAWPRCCCITTPMATASCRALNRCRVAVAHSGQKLVFKLVSRKFVSPWEWVLLSSFSMIQFQPTSERRSDHDPESVPCHPQSAFGNESSGDTKPNHDPRSLWRWYKVFFSCFLKLY